MSRTVATRRASSTAEREQQPPWRADSSVSRRGHCCRVTPTTSWPCACRSAAATEESTPPDIATAILKRAPRRCAPVDLNWESHVVEHRQLDPVVLGSVAAGPDDGPDALAREVELSPGLDPHRRRNVVCRRRDARLGAASVDISPDLGPARVAEVDARAQVVGEPKRRALRAQEATEQLDAQCIQRAVVQVVTPAVAGCLRVADEAGRGRRKLVRGPIQETGLSQPPNDVAIAN